jgi:hypothetical protein
MRSFLLCAVLSVAAAGAAELTGYISDSACGAKNAQNTAEARECARACVKSGSAPVFVKEGDTKVYKIAQKDKVMNFVGERVVVSGKLESDGISIEGIRKAGK